MSLRKIAALLAVFGVTIGLVGSGLGAQFVDQVTATQTISVGTFACQINSTTVGAVVAGDHKSVTYTAPQITSSAAGNSPFVFTVTNTGSIGQTLNVTTSSVPAPFSIIGAPFAAANVAASGTHTYNTGLQWTELSNANLGQTVTATWTVACNETSASGGTAIFDNTAATLAPNYASYGPEAYAFNEWGGGVTFAGTARKLQTATVTLSSWACQSGSWDVPFGTAGTCVTTPGATYSVPITFNVYNVGGGNTVGTLIATQTQTFAVPFRPSSISGGDGKTWDGTDHGLANNITFTFSGQTLPSTAVFGITFNTDNYGYSHINGSNAPTDSLNIATYPGTGTATQASVGTWLPDDVSGYLSTGSAPTTYIGSAAVTHMPTGTGDNFVGYEPAVQITATN